MAKLKRGPTPFEQVAAGRAVPRSSLMLDVLTVVLLVLPVYSSFFPLESYLSLGSGAEFGYVNLPIPVTTISLVLIVFAVGYYFFLVQRAGRVRHEYLAYLFIAVAFLSFAWSSMPGTTVIRALRLIPYVFLGLILPQVYSLPKLLRLMTIAFLIAALLSIFMSVAVPSLGGSRLGGGYENAWRGAIVHKNLTGIVFATGVLVVWAAVSLRAVGIGLAAATVLPCLLMLVRSQSGTAMAGLGLAAVLGAGLVVVQRCPMRIRLLLLLVVLLFSIGATLTGLMVVDAIFSAAGRDMTFTGRTPIWAAVWDLIQSKPLLGYGYAFWTIQSATAQRITQIVGTFIPHSHNSWLDLWLQLGIVGMGTVAAMTLIGMGLSLKLILTSSHRLAAPMFAIQFLLLFRSLTEVQYSDPFVSLLFFPVWGLVCARIALVEARHARVQRPIRRSRAGHQRGFRPHHA